MWLRSPPPPICPAGAACPACWPLATGSGTWAGAACGTSASPSRPCWGATSVAGSSSDGFGASRSCRSAPSSACSSSWGSVSAAGTSEGTSAVCCPDEPSSISARFVPTDTVSPSGTRIFVRVPATGEGTSVSTLSVEISNSGSSRPIASPSAFSHLRIVPSMTVSPSCGMVTVVGMVCGASLRFGSSGSQRRQRPGVASPLRQPVHGGHDVVGQGEERVLQGRRERHGVVRRRQAHHRRVEVLEGLLRDDRGHLRADPQVLQRLVQHQGPRGLRHRLHDGIDVERIHGPEVHHLRTVYPLDVDTIVESVAKTSRALVLYESLKYLGIGSEVAAVIAEEAFEHLDAPVMRLAPPNHAVPFSPPLEDAFLPLTDDIVAAVDRLSKW